MVKVVPSQDHPYHYWEQKNFFQKTLDWAVPVAVFAFYFSFYNFGKITPSEMIKTTGLVSITLLSLTLISGPICAFLPSLSFLRIHRKFWGISSFVVGFVHAALAVVFYYKLDLTQLFNTLSDKYLGIISGFLALAVLFTVTAVSNQSAVKILNPRVWKLIQTTSYLALFLALAHFFVMESSQGVLVIKRLLGKIAFVLAICALVLRVVVLVFPRHQK